MTRSAVSEGVHVRLLAHADYLGRQGRSSLADELYRLVEVHEDLTAAALALVPAAEDALRHLNPDKGCGYPTYRMAWDGLRSALTRLQGAV